jgi:hypothetical protein
MDRDLALVQRINLSLIRIDTGDVMAEVRKAPIMAIRIACPVL